MQFRGLHWPLALLLCLLILASGATRAVAASPSVLIVTSEEGGAYDEVINSIRAGLALDFPHVDVRTIRWNEHLHGRSPDTGIIVTVGARAAAEVGTTAGDTPILNTLLPRETFARLSGERPAGLKSQLSAIFLDQPISRQIALLAEGLPEWRRIALISGPETRVISSEIGIAAHAAGFEVLTVEVSSDRELYSAMQRTLAQPAVLIAVPDREIYNSHTIQNILLTSYRQKSPLIGFSPAYVRAGALLAVYSTPAQIGAQAAEAVMAVLRGEPLPDASYPERFDVGINSTVARSLGIRLDTAEVIADRIRLRESVHD